MADDAGMDELEHDALFEWYRSKHRGWPGRGDDDNWTDCRASIVLVHLPEQWIGNGSCTQGSTGSDGRTIINGPPDHPAGGKERTRTMANRHRAQRRAAGGRTLWNAKGSGTAGAINAKHGFKFGGTVEAGKAGGGPVKARGDRFAKGGRTGGKSPFSSANFGGHGGHAGPHHKATGGRVGYKKGGKVPTVGAFRRGGKPCKDDGEEEDDGDDDEEGHARGGHVKHKVGGGPAGTGVVPGKKVYSGDEAQRYIDEYPVAGRNPPTSEVSDPGMIRGDPYLGKEKRGGGIKKK